MDPCCPDSRNVLLLVELQVLGPGVLYQRGACTFMRRQVHLCHVAPGNSTEVVYVSSDTITIFYNQFG